MLQAAAVQGTCRRARVESPKTSPIELTPRTTFGHALAWWISWIREKKNALASSVSSIFWSSEFSAYIILLSLGMQLLMAYFEDLSNFGLYHVLWPSVITKKKSWPILIFWELDWNMELGNPYGWVLQMKNPWFPVSAETTPFPSRSGTEPNPPNPLRGRMPHLIHPSG